MKTYHGCSITIATSARYGARDQISAGLAVRFPGAAVEFITDEKAAVPYLVETSITDWDIQEAPRPGVLGAGSNGHNDGGGLFFSARDALSDALSVIH
jgi:hypothetical protein